MIDVDRIDALLARLEQPGDPPRPEGLSDAEVSVLEDYLHTPLPDDLRDWLKFSNGAFIGTVPAFGAYPLDAPLSMGKILEIFPTWRVKKWIPVASDGCGNYYVIPTQGEFGEGFPVVFVEAVTDKDVPRYIVASDLARFIILLIEDELALMATDPAQDDPEASSWFDKQKMLHYDPAILNFHGVSLPWEADEV